MLKEEIFKQYDVDTKQTYKNQPLYIGDVYENEVGTKSIVLKEEDKIYLIRENGSKFELPSQKAAFKDSNFVANVVQDIDLMNFWINKGVIIDKEEVKKEENMIEHVVEVIEEQPKKPTKAKKKEEKTQEVNSISNPKMLLFRKISNIRLAWANSNIEKEGKGRAGGGAKYDYYKPQQIIDFCLAEELKNNLFSHFSVNGEECLYSVIDLDTSEEAIVTCPFAIPKKMAASEAQQVGAAMTYHNRRLAMMMYKIEDNSKESVDVLENANYPKEETSAPFIPAPPIEPKAPTSPIEQPKIQEVQNTINAPKVPITPNVVVENDKKDDLPPWKENIKPIQIKPPVQPTVPQTAPQAQSVPTNSIESLY